MQKLILLFVLIAVFLVAPLLWYQKEISKWPEVTGHITKSEPGFLKSHIAWEYTVAGKHYDGYDNLDTIVSSAPKVGDELKLQIAPDDPANSIAPDLNKARGLNYLLGAGIVTIIAIPYALLRRRRKLVSK